MVGLAATKNPGATWFWDSYWQADRMAACLAPEQDNYPPAVRGGWERFFSGFADGARLLDIGTGNGAIAIIAAETAHLRQRRFEIDAVDSADIDPLRYVKSDSAWLAAIRFHPQTAAESLPFADACFDGICGQYALEYTDVPATLREIRRVARPGAQTRFVLHAADGTVVQGALRHLDAVSYLSQELVFLKDAGRTPEICRRRCGEAIDRIALRAQGASAGSRDMFISVIEAFRQAAALPPDRMATIGPALAPLEEALDGHRLRLRALCAGAADGAELARITGDLAALGFDNIGTAPIYMTDSLVGYELVARLPAA